MMNILIVEDNEAMRRLIRNVCAPVWRCHECSDGSEALAAYARHHPDWVLIDLDLKTTDGIAIVGHIHAAFPEAKIAIVTNHDDADLWQAALTAGACGYVLKENLLALRELIGDPRTTTDPRQATSG